MLEHNKQNFVDTVRVILKDVTQLERELTHTIIEAGRCENNEQLKRLEKALNTYVDNLKHIDII